MEQQTQQEALSTNGNGHTRTAVRLSEELLQQIEQLSEDQLRERVKELSIAQQELEQMRYVDNSIARFNEVMRLRVDSTLESWADGLLMELVPFVEGLQAALFMLDEAGEQPTLKRIGGYALPDDALNQLEVGQGLTGQVVKTGRMLYYESPDYFEAHTQTSLSEVQANVILVMPLVQNDVVEGVLEITALEAFAQDKLEFLRSLSENIAGNLVTLRSQVQIQSLYQEAQEQKEQMQAQEEEMRQNVEELEATQEEMRRAQARLQESENRLKALLDNIPVGIYVLQADGKPYYANARAIELLGNGINPDAAANDLAEQYKVVKEGTDDTYPNEQMPVVRALKGETSSVDDMEILRGSKRLPVEALASPVYDKEDNLLYAIATFRDVSERKSYERQMQEKNEELASREEELRQNLEELEATQDQMRQAQLEALQQRSIMDSILDSSDNTIITVDTDLNLLLVNKQVRENYQASGVEIEIGQPVLEILPPEQHDYYREVYTRALRGERFTEEFNFSDEQGDRQFFEVDYYPIHGKDKEVLGAAAVARDVSERRQQQVQLAEKQKELEAANHQMRLASTSAKMAPWQLDLSNGEFQFNELFFDLLNLEEAEFPGYRMSAETYARKVIHPEDQALLVEALQRATQPAENWENQLEYRIIDPKTNELRHMRIFVETLQDESGNATQAVGSIQDITEQKKADDILQASQEENKNLIQTAPVGICLTKPDGTFAKVNQTYCDIYGYTEEELLGQHFTIVTRPGDKEYWEKKHQNFIAGEDEVTGEFYVQRKDGTPLIILAESSRIQSHDGQPLKVTFVIDITQRKRQEEKMQQQEEELRQNLEELAAAQENLRQQAAELQQNNLELCQKEAIFQNARDSFWVLDGPKIIDANPASFRLFGVDPNQPQELIGKTPGDFSPEIQPDGRPSDEKAGEMIGIALEEGANNFYWKHHKADGTELDIEVTLARFQHEEKTLVFVYHNDITEELRQKQQIEEQNQQLKSSEEELRQNLEELASAQESLREQANALEANNKRFKSLGNNLPGMLFQYIFFPDSGEHGFLWAADNSSEVVGLEAEAFVGKYGTATAVDLHEADQPSFENAFVESIQTLKPFNWEGRIFNPKEDQYVTIRAHSAPAAQADGSIVWDGYFERMDLNPAADQLLHQQRSRIEKALSAKEIGLWDWNIQNGAIYFSDTWKTMLGYEPEELEDSFSTFENLAHPEDFPKVQEAIDQYLNGEREEYKLKVRLKQKNGRYRKIITEGVLERDEQGNPLVLTGFHSYAVN